MEFVALDQEIEAKDGRNVRRIAMMMGEHEVRNKEYEAVKYLLERLEISGNGQPGCGFMVACSDGIIMDDECLSLLAQGRVVIADETLTPEELWAQAKKDPNPAYAFLFSTEDEADAEAEQYQKFLALYKYRMPIYRRISK